MDKDMGIEEWIIYMLFAQGKSIGRLTRKFKLKAPAIEDIVRRKDRELKDYKPINRRQKNGLQKA